MGLGGGQIEQADTESSRLADLKIKLEQCPTQHTYVNLESSEFMQFVKELEDPKQKEDKRPYDVCLQCWQFQTPYKMSMHQKIGHEGIKGNMIKTKEDFLVLAKVYNRISQDGLQVALFAKYGKFDETKGKGRPRGRPAKKETPNALNGHNGAFNMDMQGMMDVVNGNVNTNTNGGTKKKRKNKNNVITQENLLEQLGLPPNLDLSALGNMQLPPNFTQIVQPPQVNHAAKAQSDQQSIIHNTQVINMLQNMSKSIIDFKQELSNKVEELARKIDQASLLAQAQAQVQAQANTHQPEQVPEFTPAQTQNHLPKVSQAAQNIFNNKENQDPSMQSVVSKTEQMSLNSSELSKKELMETLMRAGSGDCDENTLQNPMTGQTPAQQIVTAPNPNT